MSTFASSRETTEGRIYSVTGGDWDDVARDIGSAKEERVVVNMGPQHPSTHGVLRLVLELEGETITELRCGIGYLPVSKKIRNIALGHRASHSLLAWIICHRSLMRLHIA
jgi:hypothetical protein